MKTFRLLAASAIALTAAAPILAAPASGISAQRLSDVDKYISSDAFEGRGPATRAETKTIDYIVAAISADRPSAGRRHHNGQRNWTQHVPLLKSDIAGNPQFTLNLGNGQSLQLTQGDQIALKAPLNGQNDDQPRQRAVAVRRLWRDRAGTRLGRLQGPGRARQAARRPHQRPRFRGRRRRLRRQGDDLLRPLDLQI